jgi:hypothetical protein
MAQIVPLFKTFNGVYRDNGREAVPAGKVWYMSDFLPSMVETPMRGRQGWLYQNTDNFGAQADGLLLANYASGNVLMAAIGASLRRVPEVAPGASTLISASSVVTRQNPFMHRDRVIVTSGTGASAAKFVTFNGSTFTVTDAPVSALTGKYGIAWKDRVVLAGSSTNLQGIAFSKPGDPTVAWDAISIFNASSPIVGLAGMRSQILIFHDKSVERLRGTTPPDSTLSNPTGDMILDMLYDKAGCIDARTIANWQDNVIFADNQGIWLTDGSSVRSLTAQAGVSAYWKSLIDQHAIQGSTPSMRGGVIGDFYLCSMIASNGALAPETFVINIPTRNAFFLHNIIGGCFASGYTNNIKLFAGIANDGSAPNFRVMDLTPIFSEKQGVVGGVNTDGNGVLVKPTLQTPWTNLGREGRKRMQYMQMRYVAYAAAPQTAISVGVIKDPALAYGASNPINFGFYPDSQSMRRGNKNIGLALEGVAFDLAFVASTYDARIYEIGAVMTVEGEPSRMPAL